MSDFKPGDSVYVSEDAMFKYKECTLETGCAGHVAVVGTQDLEIAMNGYEDNVWVSYTDSCGEDTGLWAVLPKYLTPLDDPETSWLESGEEIRVTSSTGGQKGQKLARFDLIPEDSLWQLAEAYGKNLAKYPLNEEDGLENWRHGYNWSLSYAAMERHLNQSKAGEKLDPEFNVNHLASVAWHAFTLMHYMEREDLQHFDDRQSTLLKKYLENEND